MHYAPLLNVTKPVPEDIDIAQSVPPEHVRGVCEWSHLTCTHAICRLPPPLFSKITKIAEGLGLVSDEYEMHGIHKVSRS